MVKSLFNSLSLRKECCNLKSTNELALLIISLANPGFQSHVNLKTIQRKSKRDSTHPPQPLLQLLRSSSCSNRLNDTVPRPSVHGCCFNLLYAIQICVSFQSVDESCCFSPSTGASNGRLPKNKM